MAANDKWKWTAAEIRTVKRNWMAHGNDWLWWREHLPNKRRAQILRMVEMLGWQADRR